MTASLSNRKNVYLLAVLTATFLFATTVQARESDPFDPNPEPPAPNYVEYEPYTSMGYTCVFENQSIPPRTTRDAIVCTRSTAAYYSGLLLSPFVVKGILNAASTEEVTPWATSWVTERGSPFVYLKNVPDGEVLVTPSSAFNTFYPAVPFNGEAGWSLKSEKGIQSVAGKKVDSLFYEFAYSKVTLNRHGKNFSSKDELLSFLKESDFFSQMHFTEEQKINSLGYILKQIESAPTASYYYLTILDDKSVAELSDLTVSPKPNAIERTYFAVYPSVVPVTTQGDFMYPKPQETSGFSVKETGELFVQPNVFVVFK